ncbi:MAG: hypothetical protein K8R76_10960 [Candidatus Aegiribacteria sp.]|nr:hypothetical protein [Candidatus Aegiribacteria sp.]
MNTNRSRSYCDIPKGTGSGAAYVISLAVSAVVILSISLLFGYVSKASEKQKVVEKSTQATLSHDAAIEYAAFMYGSGRISPEDSILPVETGGMISRFRLIESTPVESRTLRYEFPGVSELSAVPSRSGLLVAGNTTDDSVIVYLREYGEDRNRVGFPVTICSVQGSWILKECVPDIEPLAVLACDNTEVDVLIAISDFGSSSAYSLGDFRISESSVITTGLTESGPVVVINDGFNAGIAIELDSGEIRHLYSATGTCPVIMPDGKIFGEISSDESIASTLNPPLIKDVFFGDFDLDGYYDTVWASKDCLACMSSTRGMLLKDEVESAELIAWGYIQDRHGLGGLWDYGNSEVSWRKYLVHGFQNLNNHNVLLDGYNGRIFSYRNTLTGHRNGSTEIVTSDISGQVSPLLNSGIPGDFNGSGGIDIAVISEENMLLYLDPAGSEDVLVELEISTGRFDEEPELRNMYTFNILFSNRNRLDILTPVGRIRG